MNHKTDADTELQKHCSLSEFEALCGARLDNEEFSSSSAVSTVSLVTPNQCALHKEKTAIG